MTSINDIVNNFDAIYDKILDNYKNDILSFSDKWKEIAKLLHDNSEVINKIYVELKNSNRGKKILHDHESNFTDINKNIKNEKNNIMKIVYIISGLHIIVYDIMSKKENYYFDLDGQSEMQILPKPLTYYINISIKTEQNIFFHAFILIYALESLINKHFYLGIDFEFTNKKIQLAQLNFEHNCGDKSIIMIVNPNELEPVMTRDFINMIMCNKYIKKILHGSDSLDIPYVYEHLLGGNDTLVKRFTRSVIDTRFMCEYYKLSVNGSDERRCSIYDEDPQRSAIFFFKVVSEQQQDNLKNLLESMPNAHDREWNIHKMSSSQIKYAQYDVLYLKWFYYKIIHDATLQEPTVSGKKSIIEMYKNVLNEITRFVYLERNKYTGLMEQCKLEVDPVNNFFIKKLDGAVKMIDIYNKSYVNIDTVNPRVSIDKLIRVNHFKTPVLVIIKRLVYGFISKKCRIQKDKNNVWEEKLDNEYIFDFLEKMQYRYMLKMFREISVIIEQRIDNICRNKR